MRPSALVVGHADADGHLITEQVRRNLTLLDRFDVRTVVDPARTRDHRVWNCLDEITEVGEADFVFFVDLMFSPKSYYFEAQNLISFANHHADKSFFLLDHHPLPLRQLQAADNLRVSYRPDVHQCAIGPKTEMMVVAALCESQPTAAEAMATPFQRDLARGMKRAAAWGNPMPGERLLTLLQNNYWWDLYQLGVEDGSFHRSMFGWRSSKGPGSKVLQQLNETAESLLTGSAPVPQSPHYNTELHHMPYDGDGTLSAVTQDSGNQAPPKEPCPYSRDLDTIVTTLELAALSLTTKPGATFTREKLMSKAHEFVGPEIRLRDEDVDLVIKKQGPVKRSGKKLCLR